jgi:hypothetical protein
MSEPTNAVLLEKIENLTKNMDDGFKGVYERQDKTNGNVMTNTSFRLKAEANITLVKWIISVLGIGNILLLAKIAF